MIVWLASAAILLNAPAGLVELFDSTSKDFGRLPRGSINEHRFVLTNTTSSTIRLSGLRTTCRCATPKAEVAVAEAGEQIVIRVTYDTTTFTGPRSMTIYATFDRPSLQTVSLRVKGHSRQDVVCNPGQVDFGTVQQGSTAEQSATVEYAGSLDWKITEVFPSKSFAATFERMYRRPGQVGYRVHIALKQDSITGLISEGVRLKTNDPESPEVVLIASANVTGVLTASPGSLDFGTVPAGQKASRKVLLHGKQTFTITDVHGMSDTLRVFSTKGKRSVHLLKIDWQATKRSGANEPETFAGELSVCSDLEGEAPVKIRVAGTVRP